MVGNESWNRYVFRRLQKTGSVGAEVTSCGKLFYSLLVPLSITLLIIIISYDIILLLLSYYFMLLVLS